LSITADSSGALSNTPEDLVNAVVRKLFRFSNIWRNQ
jgi:hypothetical protein